MTQCHRINSITFRQKRTGKFFQEEQSTWLTGHEGRGNPRRWLMTKSHPQRQTLPLHPTTKRSICPSDDLVTTEKQAWTDCVGEGGDMSCPAFETGQRVLFDRERMKFRTQPMCLFFLFGNRREFCGEMRFPECDVTDATDPEDRCQLGSLRPKLANPFRVC